MNKNRISKGTKHLTMAAFLYMLVTCFVFSSCGNDDEDGVDLANLEGTWELTIEEGVEEGEGFHENHSGDDIYLVFKENTCIECSKDESTGKWYTYSNPYHIDEENGILAIGENEYQIMKLTSNELKLNDLDFIDYIEDGDWMHLTYRKVNNGNILEE